MKQRLSDLKLAAVLVLLAVSNFALDGYPTCADPECEECEAEDDDDRYCDISIRFEPSLL